MESKTIFAHSLIAFFLLASLFQTSTAGHLEIEISDGVEGVIKLPKQQNENEMAKTSPHPLSDSICGEGKSAWPELVGTSGEAAKAIIEKENPKVLWVEIIPEGSIITADFRCGRVRIFVDEDGKVVNIPYIG